MNLDSRMHLVEIKLKRFQHAIEVLGNIPPIDSRQQPPETFKMLNEWLRKVKEATELK